MSDALHCEPGTELPSLTVQVTRTDLVRYAGASTDFNPIHHSHRAASALGLDDVIAHGMLTMGLALRVVTEWAGDPGRVKSYFVRFTRPVLVPDTADGATVVFGGVVKSVADGIASVSLEARSADDKVLGGAVAEVRLD